MEFQREFLYEFYRLFLEVLRGSPARLPPGNLVRIPLGSFVGVTLKISPGIPLAVSKKTSPRIP